MSKKRKKNSSAENRRCKDKKRKPEDTKIKEDSFLKFLTKIGKRAKA